VEAVRADFPVLSRQVNGRPLVYLDNASSSHKPRQVLEAERAFVEQHYSNVHRGVHTLSQEATDAYEAARDTVARFLGATDSREVVFTKNATEAYNLVAYSFGNAKAGERFALGPGDEVCVTEMEHHSNLVPWQMLCERTGATLRLAAAHRRRRLDLTDLETLVNERTKVLAFVHQSNCSARQPVDVLVRRRPARSVRSCCSTPRSRRTCRST
jgi:cysteine desulfurase/selenocysteine lyase